VNIILVDATVLVRLSGDECSKSLEVTASFPQEQKVDSGQFKYFHILRINSGLFLIIRVTFIDP